VEFVGRGLVLGQPEDGVLEGEQRAGVDLEREVEVEWTSTTLFGMELHLPDLPKRVRLNEVTLVVDVETMIDGVVLEVGYVSGHVDDCHSPLSLPVAGSLRYRRPMDDAGLLEALHAAATAVADVLANLIDWRAGGTRSGQYHLDIVADAAAVAVLEEAGLGVVSEESGSHNPERAIVVALDPVDGSTNASRGIPWYATSLCAVDEEGPRASVVVNQANGVRYEAVRRGGARKDGQPIGVSGCEKLSEAIIAFSGYPPRYLGWSQYRAFGAAALDLCAVAEGSLDAYATVGGSRLGCWDYLGGVLVCTEAGGMVDELGGVDLLTLKHEDRRRPVAASTSVLLRALEAVVAR
jgi:myo-inositol-1(or 4)-monophosphatase